MPLKNNILITGTSSGLGKYLSQNLGCVALTRENKAQVLLDYRNNCFDAIVHCAFNPERKVSDWYQYLQDNILLTKELAMLPHKKFIYFSSIDIYRDENTNYKLTKLMAESVVQKMATSPLILRCSAILGETMRPNSLAKLLFEKNAKLSLASLSSFNYILQSDILEAVSKAVHTEIEGVVDFVSSTDVFLSDVDEMYGSEASFGSYVYMTPRLSNAKITKLSPKVNKTSEEVIVEYYNELKHG